MYRPQEGETECSQTHSRPSLPLTACLQFGATPPEQGRASTATKRLNQRCFIYGSNNGVSWENFGFPFPEAKTHLQNVLEIYYCLFFFPTTFSEPP